MPGLCPGTDRWGSSGSAPADPVLAFPELFETSGGSHQVTGSATPHALGAWTELIASTSADATWALVTIAGLSGSGTDTRALVNIGVGAGGAEQIVIDSLNAGSTGGSVSVAVAIPVAIPAGSRVAAQMRSLIASDIAVVSVGLLADDTPSPSSVDTIGADTANSRGTNMPTSDTYVQLIAATTQDYQALVLTAAGGGASMALEESLYTLAIGPGGSETPVTTLPVASSSQEYIVGGGATLTGFGTGVTVGAFGGIYIADIPAGTRIACKQSVGRTYRDAIVFGIPYA